jgi:hypothetical protein
MYNTEEFQILLNYGETASVNGFGNNTLYGYNIHTAILISSRDLPVNLTVNGINITLPNSFVLNQFPIRTITLNTNNTNILLIGRKDRKIQFGEKTKFDNNNQDLTINNFVVEDYIDDYFE